MALFIVTSSAGMQRIYGAEGYQLILAKSRELTSSIPGAQFNVLDDVLSMGQHSAAKENTPSSLNAALSQLTDMPPAANNTQPSILILGDHRIFPYFQVPNPVQNPIDPDSNVLTDNPYGSGDSQNPNDWLQPELVVGRIAAGVSDSAQDFCKLLDVQISLRKARPIRAGYVEFTSRQWQNTSAFVMSALASPNRVFVSPDDRIAAPNASNLDCKFLYCNLHGFQNQPAWQGFDPGTGSYVPALTPDAFSAQYLQGSIVFSEACYGLQTQGRNTSSSCALSLLAAGAAVVGSTGLAFGSSTPQPQTLIDADALARGFFDRALQPNATLGSCLQAARLSLQQSAPTLDVYLQKTLLEFQLLGDPSYAI
jgi:hypothetical protein